MVTGAGVAAEEAFVDTDQRYLQADAGENRDDGCTAVTAVLVGQRLVVAHVGDSRAVLLRAGQGAQALLLLCSVCAWARARRGCGSGRVRELRAAGRRARSTGAVSRAEAQSVVDHPLRQVLERKRWRPAAATQWRQVINAQPGSLVVNA